ncbi:hypothetical protein ACVOMV_03860 [Mesorhizobium atlanticum]
MPEYSSFLRSIRIRYISGLLVFALASAAVMFALNRVNSYRHEVDALSGNVVIFARDLRNATNFAETTGTALAQRDARRAGLRRARPLRTADGRDRGPGMPSSRPSGRNCPGTRSMRSILPRSTVTCSGRRAIWCATST